MHDATREPPAGTHGVWPAVTTVAPIAHAQGALRLPGSKSMSNRALLLAALAQGTTELSGLLDADDTRVMVAALGALGIAVEPVGSVLRVQGCAGRIPARTAELHLGNAGTAMRPLAAALAFAGGRYRLDGVARMRERPIGDLVEALNAAGADLRYLGKPGYPPLQIEPAQARIPAGGLQVRGDVSSQFLSGLLMAAPGFAPPGGLRIGVAGTLISQPYVAMTVSMLRDFGIGVTQDEQGYVVAPGVLRAPGPYAIEGDASGASYFLALGAIAGGPVQVQGVGRGSVQGDLAFVDVLRAMGARVEVGEGWIEARGPDVPAGTRFALQPVEIDATKIPDAAMTVAVLALFADGTTRLTGIGSWRVKETDRIAAMATELARFGARVQSGPDWLAVTPPERLRPARVDTYDDHRMAMCLALAAAGGVAVQINDPACVSKTFPDYFVQLARLCAGAA